MRRLSGRSPKHLPPAVLHTLGTAARRGKDRRRSGNLLAASGLATLVGSFSASTLLAAVLGVVLFFSTAAGAYAYVSNSLPDVRKFEARPFGTTRIFDRNGRLLHEVSDPELGWRTNIKRNQVSDWAVAATMAAEDPTFMQNPGVDPVGIARAVLINYSGTGSSGASTITMQVVRLLYPDSIGDDVTITRKVREALLALNFARTYSKEEVLMMYLNEIYYGNRSYGIHAAAESYFGKPAKDLDLAEASMLAGLPQAPSYYDPRFNFEVAKVRQRYVLEQMVKVGAIDRQQLEAAYAQPLMPMTREGRYNDAPHFVNYIRYYLEQKYGAERVFRGDLQVQTTLDLEIQRTGERIVKEQIAQLRANNVTNGALVAMIPATGEILAMVGSADYTDDSIDGQVNVTTRERQPGSSIKPMAYAAAFEKGWHPGTRIMDVKTVFPLTTAAYGELDTVRQQGRDLPPEREKDEKAFYLPENHDYKLNGAVTVREALARSLNIPAVKASQFAGVDRVIDVAHRMGIRSGLWRGQEFYGYSISLGGGEVQLLEHTNAYATFANMGKYVPFNPILKIVNGLTGQTIEELDRAGALDQAQQVIAPEIAYQITSITTDNAARSVDYGVDNALVLPELGRPAGAKTGTTSDYRDTWTMGYTTDLVVGVWAGNSNNTQTNDVLSTRGAAPIWHNFQVEVHRRPELARHLVAPNGQPYPTEFARPPGVVEAEICVATGKKPAPGQSTRKEIFAPTNLPQQACGELTPEENLELDIALRSISRDAGTYAAGGIQRVLEYRAAATSYRPVTLSPPPGP
jgi:membrane peptidoglycan carboxypeptidase